jgi:hypothetical protein
MWDGAAHIQSGPCLLVNPLWRQPQRHTQRSALFPDASQTKQIDNQDHTAKSCFVVVYLDYTCEICLPCGVLKIDVLLKSIFLFLFFNLISYGHP